ncbi:MAG: protein kinase [Chloroflexota bacterium]|nr:protein kinase [Chloroflexota bacterium]
MIQPQSLIKGRYRVGRRLGDGGMAIVYLGHDLLLGRDVAIKTLRPQFAADPAFRSRFEREARAAAALSHPNIIDVYDVGEENGSAYIVMELIRGQTLKEIIAADAPFHPDDVAALLGQIGGALDYAHAIGYVHRDVKPGNILVDELGRARVVDFGIAKGLADADLTEQGTGLGTVGYLSPEQAAGLMATPASDIYSAGVVAFEMLTGELPFSAETPVGVAMRHVNDPAPPPSRIAPLLPRQVDTVVLRALDKDPTRRWPSVVAFSQALRGWRDMAPIPPRTVVPPPNPAPRGSLAPTIVVVILVVGALAALLWSGFRGLPSTENVSPPTVLVPRAPVITGGVAEDDPPAVEVAPTIALQETPSPIPTQTPTAAPVLIPPETDNSQPPPTIAPVAAGAVIVPELQGMTIAQANRALSERGLRIVPIQPVFSESVPMNGIAAQDPPAGTSASSGATISVSLSRGRSPFPDDGQP